MEKAKKEKWVKVRIDPVERDYWHDKARESGRTLSDLIRDALDRVRRWTPENKNSERERLSQLARIGSNLNQIAKWVNTYKSGADATQVIAKLCSIELAIAELKQPRVEKEAGKEISPFPTAPIDSNAGE